MSTKLVCQTLLVPLLVIGPWLTACSPAAPPPTAAPPTAPRDEPAPTAGPETMAAAARGPSSGGRTATPVPEWYTLSLTDVHNGQPFTIASFAWQVVLIMPMAQQCPNCLLQQEEVRQMRHTLGNPPLFLVSLDVDPNDDAGSLKAYADQNNIDWRAAVAPEPMTRALGQLYGADLLNPSLTPMLLIDQYGVAHLLSAGLKQAEELRISVEPYLLR